MNIVLRMEKAGNVLFEGKVRSWEKKSKSHKTLKLAGSSVFCACDLPMTLITLLATAMQIFSLE